jgi:hypothetical protein
MRSPLGARSRMSHGDNVSARTAHGGPRGRRAFADGGREHPPSCSGSDQRTGDRGGGSGGLKVRASVGSSGQGSRPTTSRWGDQFTDRSAGTAGPTASQSVVRPLQERADTPLTQRQAGFSGEGVGREQHPTVSLSLGQPDGQEASGDWALSAQWGQLEDGSSGGVGASCVSALPEQQQQQWLHWSSIEQPQGRSPEVASPFEAGSGKPTATDR